MILLNIVTCEKEKYLIFCFLFPAHHHAGRYSFFNGDAVFAVRAGQIQSSTPGPEERGTGRRQRPGGIRYIPGNIARFDSQCFYYRIRCRRDCRCAALAIPVDICRHADQGAGGVDNDGIAMQIGSIHRELSLLWEYGSHIFNLKFLLESSTGRALSAVYLPCKPLDPLRRRAVPRPWHEKTPEASA